MGEQDCSGRLWLYLSTAERSRGLAVLMQRWDKILGKPIVRIRGGLCHYLSNFTASLLGFMVCCLELCDITGTSQFDATSVAFVLQPFIQSRNPSSLGGVCCWESPTH